MVWQFPTCLTKFKDFTTEWHRIPLPRSGGEGRVRGGGYFQVAYWKRGTSSTPTVRERFLFTPYMVLVVKKGIQ